MHPLYLPYFPYPSFVFPPFCHDNGPFDVRGLLVAIRLIDLCFQRRTISVIANPAKSLREF
jgi:hypothetical protein